MVDKRLMNQLKQHRRQFSVLVGLGLGGGVLAVLQADFMAKIINGVFLAQLDWAGVSQWMAALFVVMTMRSIFVWLIEVTAHSLAAYIKKSMRQRILTSLFALGPMYIKRQQTGELINVLVEGVENLEPYFAKFLPQLFTAVTVPLVVLSVAFPLDITTGIILLLTAPLIPVFMILIGRTAEQVNKRQWETLSRLSAHFLDVLQGLTVLKIFGRSIEQIQVIHRMSSEFRDKTLGVLKIAFLSALVLELVATISTALVAVTIGLKLLYYKMEFSQAFFLLLLAPEFYLPLRQLGTHFHAGMAGSAAAERIFGILSLPKSWDVKERTIPLARQQQISIAFENVHYAYDNGERLALNGVSFAIKPGETVALVGASGSGKSTIASLLLAFMHPDKGHITVNDMNLTDIRLEDWLSQVAFVPQSPHLFYKSVADNIRLGRENASLETIMQAAKNAGAHEFIMGLPEGYDTLVGEGGHGLSGGECKRLAIARAFLQDAPFLLLDEATAGLDPQSEAVIDEALSRLMQKRTVLIIAHRLSTVYKAHCIVVLHDGKQAEAGPHEELMKNQGLYSQLVLAFRGEK
ncbi:ATP-binding cassette, subfamily C, CydD [Pelosinus fermentans]|uniref:thiol reductant ABC exporter subunit CydD n=1 Tax=Pelosinus fermentans TaxID=365349 RepID=UPI0002684B9B|nr:thiol reductant ABC exporter subunit CydD [Pelosinus fermentans]OAM92564.1 ABC transporter, CydDC cysteine exporter (CydDC-E) family, permease/ATP-binding protein CydD [Pelosinus fermentans DSM 17108]SDQ49112.1 ATP-binding cassette, subfamily C, CydD [Pelosinus fermentans]